METNSHSALHVLQQEVIACTRCPRLVRYCRRVAQEKRRMYRQEEYWGRPLPSFGDPEAELLILGLAPAAHGGNRTGRMFTGDRSGDFLYPALYDAGFASQPHSLRPGDGLELHGCYITASLRCAPPFNKPSPVELRRCQPHLIRELQLLKRVRAVLALGRIAFDAYLQVIYEQFSSVPQSCRHDVDASREGQSGPAPGPAAGLPLNRKLPPKSAFHFAHGISYELPGTLPRLFASYHPSQRNTQTGKLTPAMFRTVLEDIRRHLRVFGPAVRGQW